VNVPPVVQQTVSLAFVLTWVGIVATLFFRSRVKQNAYLRHFEDKIDFTEAKPVSHTKRYAQHIRAFARPLWWTGRSQR
jgi:hypothetical protein